MSTNNFFDFQERMARKPAKGTAAATATAPGGMEPLTVSQLTQKIDRAIKAAMPAVVLVKGEISNYKHHGASGNVYFTLKDAAACIDCVIWKSDAARLKFRADDGMEVIATGNVAVYGSKGRYQLYTTNLEPLGQGALELAFKQLCAKLQREGLFAAERKRPIPQYPIRIALVTSRETAAYQDMLKVLRRFPFLQLVLCHVPVQGDGSAEKIAAAVDQLSRCKETDRMDIILLARGGGSLEDLWEFNEEVVARAIVRSRIPVITGIGHEIDTSIADLVADHHAHTPTEAAQVVTAHWRQAREILDSTSARLRREIRSTFQQAKQRLQSIERHEAFRRPLDRINNLRQRLDDMQRALTLTIGQRLRAEERRLAELEAKLEECGPTSMLARLRERISRLAIKLSARHPRNQIALAKQRLLSLQSQLGLSIRHELQRQHELVLAKERHLRAVGPEQVLARGFTITTVKKGGKVIRSVKEVSAKERIVTRFIDGQVESTTDDPNQPGLFE